MLISIVIPTRDRARYLRHSLATATEISDPDIEIVVSDNAALDDTREVVAEAADPRVRYVNTGDDDGILPGQFRFLRRILENQRPDALSWDYPVYGWPVDGYGNRVGGLRIAKAHVFDCDTGNNITVKTLRE